MAYRFRGRATVDPNYPQAQGVCDRCGVHYLLKDLRAQFQWSGNSLINQNLLVCDRCLDVPQEQLRALVLPADPPPVLNARPDFYDFYNNTLMAEEGNIQTGNLIVEEDGETGIIMETTNPIDLLGEA